MGNKITEFFSKQLDVNFTNIDLLNLIRSKASNAYKESIPKIEKKHLAINHANIPYEDFEVNKNEFFDILVNRIGTTVIKSLQYQSPLSVFKRENFEYGETYQEIFVDLVEKQKYNAKSTDSPFQTFEADIKVMYHDIDNENFYALTFESEWIKKAFVSEYAFDEKINAMFNALLSSDQVDEYSAIKGALMKGLNEVAFGGGTITVDGTLVDTSQTGYIETLNQQIINMTKKFNVASRDGFYNPAGVANRTALEDCYLIIDIDYSTEIDNLLAHAYHMDKVNIRANTIVVDNFPLFTGSGTNNGRKPIAFLVSKDSIINRDKLVHMESIRNPRNLTHNVYYHHHYLTSLSMFENIHFWYTEE